MEFTQLLIRIQEVLLGVSLTIQSAEFLLAGDGLGFTPPFSRFPYWIRNLLQGLCSPAGFRWVQGVRVMLAVGLILIPANLPVLGGLMALQFLIPFRHRGAYNGGSDFMTAQVLAGTFVMRVLDSHPVLVRAVFCYLGFQTVLSYFVSGLLKIRHSGWRNGESLQGFLRSNRYGTPAWMLEILSLPGLAKALSLGILLFEVLFPLALAGPWFAWVFMVLGLGFHVLVFRVYGLNRFFWAWLSAYPALYFLSMQRWIAP